MAKNLKFKVKNVQLAKALQLKKTIKKKEAPKKIAAKDSPLASSTHSEPLKTDQNLSSQPNSAKTNHNKPLNPQVNIPTQQKPQLPPSSAKSNPPLSSSNKPSSSSSQNPSPKPQEKNQSASPETPQKNKSFSSPYTQTKPPQQNTGFKAKFSRFSKEPRKKEDSRFDARDKQGLRVGEERSYRRRPRRYRPKKDESEIIRPKTLSVRLPISIKDLAQNMKLKASELIAKLFMQGMVLTINDYLEDETIVQLLGEEFKCEISIDTSKEERLRITGKSIQEEISEAPPETLELRAPVVAFMGHVDHGKTSLIDSIRKTNTAEGEAGSITQHIGAFKCHQEHGEITILDTPGHEAFTLMRQRGSAVTDVIILVVAGDDGIKAQTDEAIDLAKTSNIPLVIAINKCDKETFDQDLVYRQLADRELLPEAWGGSVITVNCSAETGEGIPTLIEMLGLQSEILELKANPQTRARGTVIESQMHKGFGPIATVLIQNGTLKLGDALVFDDLYARIKTMHNEYGKSVDTAPPSTPVKITGLSGVPQAGCEFIVVKSEKEARKLCEERSSGSKQALLSRGRGELESVMIRHQELEKKKIVPLILRADVQGSVEAIKNSLLRIKTSKVELLFISEGVGEISESDVQRAATSGATIIGFHTRVESHAEELINKNNVVIKRRDIIYQIIDDVKQLMIDILDKVRFETEQATLEIRQVFISSQLGTIAGCMVTDGIIKKNSYIKIFREEKLIHEGEIQSLKRVKDDAKEVGKGLECGVIAKNFKDYMVNDCIKGYEISYIDQEL